MLTGRNKSLRTKAATSHLPFLMYLQYHWKASKYFLYLGLRWLLLILLWLHGRNSFLNTMKIWSPLKCSLVSYKMKLLASVMDLTHRIERRSLVSRCWSVMSLDYPQWVPRNCCGQCSSQARDAMATFLVFTISQGFPSVCKVIVDV